MEVGLRGLFNGSGGTPLKVEWPIFHMFRWSWVVSLKECCDIVSILPGTNQNTSQGRSGTHLLFV